MNKATLLATFKKKPVPVTVGETTVFVKPLTVGQKEAFALWRKDNPSGEGVVQRLVAASLCDESGALLLASPDEVNDLDGALCEALCESILDVNAMRAAAGGKPSGPSGPN